MMAADGTQLLRAGAFAFTFTIDGAITSVVADDPVEEELARRRDRDASKKRDSDASKKRDSDASKKRDGDEAKKRGRDGAKKRGRNEGLYRREESDEERGWSSAVVERSLALRHRGGSASCFHPRCGLIVGEGAAASGALGVEAEAAVAAEELLVDPTLEFFYLAVL
ncbi:hypothetical protein SEVIR_3G156800v4 [Setaria viridis]|uniref:Uncharacterized protein n=1 Tax=Setaria viridis TaxID=4556 RepID=A0A4U6VCH7_SETVI|nr:splicing factor U2af large subunit B-like [Setaria viridis]XP_034584748.1 splicing factor U2af large subunit B-like [Setaria viridis]XP_034587440.1 splicing factor U2af large subunit B-like [Setaria viridis]XP_034587441.1 splicing factor U2af large subunit B-like [Setaria viridis]TKW25984.1 hypothetical protein SEVIR_3G156625v2 [Setaria viridis]TKW25987.1 hypothetical protein SEVIR_3G156700v2 [Setaria viridis]TKW25988.1 hypothetical protein SEVIR_3G156800v2 [Setaria viridis]